jgi:hypothetical protein
MEIHSMTQRLFPLLFIAACTQTSASDAHLGKVAWETDPAAGLSKAQSSNMKAMLYFTADW